jgi:YegS/Rv2252/BmrU family lipid kinase
MKIPYFFIINLNAGGRKARQDLNKIFEVLNSHKINYKFEITDRKLHAGLIVRDRVKEGYRHFVVVGGDGTLNEAINGAFSQSICQSTDLYFSLLSVGYGNDWKRIYNIPTDYNEFATMLINPRLVQQDIGKIDYYDDIHRKTRFFINIAGFGYDALVANKVNEAKRSGKIKKVTYQYFLLNQLIKMRFHPFSIEVDGQKLFSDMFSMAIGIGKYNGNGMMQLPHSKPDDGEFDITLISKISKMQVISNVKNLYDGSFISHPAVSTYRGRKIRIESEEEIFIEADGESLGHTPCEINILPKSINIMVRNET